MWTGDNARHDNDEPLLPRPLSEILAENAAVANGLASVFPATPVVPTIGNNDVYPHDAPPTAAVLSGLASAWQPVTTSVMRDSLINGRGFMVRSVGSMAYISLNTIDLTWGQECDGGSNNTSSLQLVLLEKALASLSESSAAGVIILGHVPVSLWHQSCSTRYLAIAQNYSRIIKQHMYGHVHSDQFYLVGADGDPHDTCKHGVNAYVAVAAAPSVTPTFNPTVRFWTYNRTSGNVLDYQQYFQSLDEINANRRVDMKEEYRFSTTYNVTGPLDTQGWCTAAQNIAASTSLHLQYLLYKVVSVVGTTPACEPSSPHAWRCAPQSHKSLR